MKSRGGRVREEKRREEQSRAGQSRAEQRRGEERREEERRSKKRKSQKKEDPGARKGRKVAKHCVFPMICGSGGSKVGSLKRQVRSHVVKMKKTHHARTTFKSFYVERVHAVVARSKFPSQKCKKLTGSEHFWKLRCRCGPKHISKSKMQKMGGTEHFWTLFRCRFAWQAMGIVHLVKSEQNVRVL